jgi:four helix bundle protein
MMEMHHSRLQVWQRGMELAEAIYAVTKKFPKEELYGLTMQLRRAAVSIPSNIAEGSQRSSDKDFANFVLIAKGSLAELETQLLLAERLGFASGNEDGLRGLRTQIDTLSRMLHGLRSKLAARSSPR